MEKLNFKKLSLLLLLYCPAVCFSQFSEIWVARFNGPGNGFDATKSIATDRNGNVYVTGSSTGAGTALDYSTIKYNSAGVLQWQARYNGPGNGDDEALSIAVDAQGNVYVTGFSTGSGTGNDYATIKYNSVGVTQWVARYNGPGNGIDRANSLKVDSEGNVYVTGESAGDGTSLDYATIRYNRNGLIQWVARYDGPGENDVANALALDDAENVYVTGRSSAGEPFAEFDEDSDYTTIKYNKNGIQLWIRRYDGPTAVNLFDEAFAITVDNSGNTYVTGQSRASNVEDSDDYATVKYAANGNELWAVRYNGPGNSIDAALSVAVDSRKNVFVTGFSAAEPEETNFDYATIRYNAQGNQVWVRRYNGPADNNDQATTLVLDNKESIYVTGRSTGIGSGFDFATVKYSNTGVENWVARYNGPGNGDEIVGYPLNGLQTVTVDGQRNVYVTGGSTGIGTGLDYATIKYCQHDCGNIVNKVPDITRLAAEQIQFSSPHNKLPDRFRVFNVPNPVTAMTRIYYDLPMDGQVSLEVYDILGRKITTLVNAGMKAGAYSIQYDASGLSNGIYNYRIRVKTNTRVWTHTEKLSVAK